MQVPLLTSDALLVIVGRSAQLTGRFWPGSVSLLAACVRVEGVS